ncbi:hypothetical protein [Kingella potus]|uniref:hypothetical protein n=1 Tax=Kingella potus TaxID=265175 RepID=UPI001FD3ACC2|nr:hypothetical protein [Kingella potus]UOP01361.1 hypothetical protein LVJ84_03750 [Kingella potus]
MPRSDARVSPLQHRPSEKHTDAIAAAPQACFNFVEAVLSDDRIFRISNYRADSRKTACKAEPHTLPEGLLFFRGKNPA